MKNIIYLLILVLPQFVQAQYATNGAQCDTHGDTLCEHYESPCPPGTTIEIRFVLETDVQASETTWKLTDETDNGTIIGEGSGLDNNTLYVHSFCEFIDHCYRLIIEDSGEDGIESENGYQIYWNGELIQSGGDFGKSQIIEWGGCCTDFSVKLNGGLGCIYNHHGLVHVEIENGMPPFQYEWSSGASHTEVHPIAESDVNIAVTVTDASGCIQSDTLPLSNLSSLDVLVEATPVISTLPNVGTTNATVQSGIPPFYYVWSNGATTSSLENLSEGIYGVTVTDASGCTVEKTVTVEEIIAPSVSIASQTNVDCNGNSTGAVTVTGNGGGSPFSYAWSTGGSAQTEMNLVAGAYTVTVTDFYGFTGIVQVVITEPDVLITNASSTDETAEGANDGTATANPDGGTPPFEYSWSSSSNEQTILNLTPGEYTLTVTDANACTAIESTTISSFECGNVSLNVANVNVSCYGFMDGSATAFINNGTAPFTYLWSSGGTEMTETGLAVGSYFITITDVNNCSAFGETTIVEPDPIQLTIDEIIDEIVGNMDGAIHITPSGGTGSNYSFEWYLNNILISTEEDIDSLSAGEYIIIITDSNGCSLSDTLEVDMIDGTADLDLSSRITLWPNPTSGKVNLDLDFRQTHEVQISIYDFIGRKIHAVPPKKLISHQLYFNFSDFSAGVYLVKIMVDDQVLTKKLVIGR